ncbi:MAG: hypothetical protein ACQESR_28800 [Planctomycetota bacterium]
MESCPTQAVHPLVGLAADKVIRDRYNSVHERSILPTMMKVVSSPAIAARTASGCSRVGCRLFTLKTFHPILCRFRLE